MEALIIDPDVKDYDGFKDELARRGINVTLSTNGKDGQLNIHKNDYFCILLNPKVRSHTGWEVLRYIKETKLFSRVILVVETMDDLENYFGMTEKQPFIASIMSKPLDIEGLIANISGESEFSAWRTVKCADINSNERHEEQGEAGVDFSAISVKDFVIGNVAIFDLFVNLDGGHKFLKIFSAGEKFDRDRLQSNVEGSIEELYFRTSDRASMINYSNTLLEKMIESEQVGDDVLLSTSRNSISFFVDQIFLDGVSKEVVDEGKKICELATKMVNRNAELAKGLKDFFEGMPKSQAKAFTACFYALSIAKKLNWIPENVVNELAMASMLMDISLKQYPRDLADKRPKDMTPEELVEYKKHLAKSADFVRNLKGVNERIHQMVYQHHERIDGSGFPSGLSGIKIYPPAKILSLAAEFSDRLVEERRSPLSLLEEFINERENVLGYEPDVTKALISIFSEKKEE